MMCLVIVPELDFVGYFASWELAAAFLLQWLELDS